MAPAQPALQRNARPRLVVVGNGMAAIRTVEELLALGAPYDITVFGAEPHGNYNRIMLSAVLAGDKAVEDIVTHPTDWYAGQGITLYAGDPVVGIDPAARLLLSAGGRTVSWDRLILATGASPILPAIPGIELDGICAFRSIRDVSRMLEAARNHRRAVVIGGGVLGLEAAWGLKQQGMEVSVVHLAPWLMERQLDDTAAALLAEELARRGIACVTGAQAVAVLGETRVEAVRLSDGSDLAADLVVAAIGIRPETALAAQAGLAVERGIVVGDDMRTSAPDIFAVGECVQHDGQCYGLVAPLWDMARVCAHQLAEAGSPSRFVAPAMSTNLKIPGIEIFSAGAIAAANDAEREIVHHDPDQRVYRKLVLRQGRVVGAILFGDTGGSARFRQWIQDGTDVGALCPHALMDPGMDDVASMPDAAIVCHCAGITKGGLVAAITEHGLTTLEQVCARTGAGTSCGQCRPLAARVLAHALGRDGNAEVAAETARTARRNLVFCLWHRTNAVLMGVLLLTGLSLHFSGLMRFEWAYWLHKWSGIALVAAYGAYLAACRVFRRRNRADAQGLTMSVVMPLVVATGLAFLWPSLVPDRLFGFSGLVPVALGHLLLTVLILMFLIHHLSHAPWVWWQKRKLRHVGG